MTLEVFEGWIAGLIDQLTPGQRRKLAGAIGADLRKANAARIGAQTNPDGSPFAPRKRQARPALRTKSGRVKRKAAQAREGRMFAKLQKKMRVEATADDARIGFPAGPTSRIATVHHEGQVDSVTRRPDSPRVAYAQRQLLGVTGEDRERILERVLEHLKL